MNDSQNKPQVARKGDIKSECVVMTWSASETEMVSYGLWLQAEHELSEALKMAELGCHEAASKHLRDWGKYRKFSLSLSRLDGVHGFKVEKKGGAE